MNKQDELVLVEKQKDNASTFAMIIVFIWMMLGLLGFIMSLVCFSSGSSFMENWVGFLTSLVAGPLYWIYFFYASPTYCKSSAKIQLQKTMKQISKKSSPKKKKFM